MLKALIRPLRLLTWRGIYQAILQDPFGFSHNIRSVRDPEQRRQLVQHLLFAAAQNGFVDHETRTAIFSKAEEFGAHFLPVSFESPVPNTQAQNEMESDLAQAAGSLLKMDASAQLRFLPQVATFSRELTDVPDRAEEDQFHWQNPSFGPYDSAVYYGMIRHFQPATVVEVGSGYSTLLGEKAARKNGDTKIVCIEPYPRSFLKSGRTAELVEKKVQDVDLALFSSLEERDILFIDSSHASKIGSDVNDIFFRILPAVKKGVIIHFHDIFLPDDYPLSWVKGKNIFYNEQYLLLAFLGFNPSFEVLLAHNFLSMKAPSEMRAAFPAMPEAPVGGGSFWIRRSA